MHGMLDVASHVSLYMLNFFTREASSTNVALKHLSLKVTNKELGKEEALLYY